MRSHQCYAQLLLRIGSRAAPIEQNALAAGPAVLHGFARPAAGRRRPAPISPVFGALEDRAADACFRTRRTNAMLFGGEVLAMNLLATWAGICHAPAREELIQGSAVAVIRPSISTPCMGTVVKAKSWLTEDPGPSIATNCSWAGRHTSGLEE